MNVTSFPPYTPRRSFVPRHRICIRGKNPNHHLWNNHGTWFVHYTFYPTVSTKQRIRRSLCTQDLLVARERRDRYFGELAAGSPTTFLDDLLSFGTSAPPATPQLSACS